MEYRPILFEQIHSIVFHGNNYDWETVYNMPLWLRRTTLNLINKYYEKQQEKAEIQQLALPDTSDKKILKPGINNNPTYTVKAPNKK